ncbi:natriuretic peptides A-like [Hippoglossus hippoglossus]|uniref:natriuretic peptides A-like n=1 Tax=Hippoglossus hippoglossus TaxID=8267 RepID=UPI00148C2942|nr:natriuretic peptides A-like [Hippoglossus hippoglossus]
MRTAAVWGLLALLCQHTLVSSHILGRATSTSDLAQLKSLLERFEDKLAEAAQEEDSEADYEETNQESEHSQVSRGWSQEEEQEYLSEKPPAEGHSKPTSQRSHLQDLLMTTRKRASSCFGARIGNASGLECNGGKG